MSARAATVTTVDRWQAASVASLAGRAVAVIDVLRWSTVVVTALAHGAARIEAFGDPDDAFDRAHGLGRASVVLGGERGNVPLPGFDIGNSPLEYTPERLHGRPVLSTTTNGTAALLRASAARLVVVAAFVNLAAVTRALRAALEDGRGVTLLAAGRSGEEALEDTACAGAIAEGLRDLAPSDEATQRALALWRAHAEDPARAIAAAPHAASLRESGFEGDLAVAARRDAYDVVPVAHGRTITLEVMR